jgi:hypothetical protein
MHSPVLIDGDVYFWRSLNIVREELGTMTAVLSHI